MARVSVAVLMLVSTAVLSSGQSEPLIGNPSGRTTISLDGTWSAIVDPYESGLSGRFYENSKAKSQSDLVEYSFDRSPKLRVPG
ncbi:MAG: beta-glucuronidase, partial [Acidobacteria bacterium]|nr:beta-glucuronidase [Acidobacteriota bacterium]